MKRTQGGKEEEKRNNKPLSEKKEEARNVSEQCANETKAGYT